MEKSSRMVLQCLWNIFDCSYSNSQTKPFGLKLEKKDAMCLTLSQKLPFNFLMTILQLEIVDIREDYENVFE